MFPVFEEGNSMQAQDDGGSDGSSSGTDRVRARDIGIRPGIFTPGPLNAITDIDGVSVGHCTVRQGESICTGVTVIRQHRGNVYQSRVPAAVAVGNGHGKFLGVTQIAELGEIETPIALTNTLSVPEAAAALIDWTLEQPGNETVKSVNPVVGETNDSLVNDIRARAIRPHHVRLALDEAREGPVEEGSVGAGTGTEAFGWKGGIGSSSRVLPLELGGYGVGALIQTNYGGVLTVDGHAVGQTLLHEEILPRISPRSDGSVIVVLATDAPLSDRDLGRLARRGLLGLARTGSSMADGSGDYVIAFSTSPRVRRTPLCRGSAIATTEVPNQLVSALFAAVVESVEEAAYNAMLMATSVTSSVGTLERIPLDKLLAVLNAGGRRYQRS